jgi:hypothetical protein
MKLNRELDKDVLTGNKKGVKMGWPALVKKEDGSWIQRCSD